MIDPINGALTFTTTTQGSTATYTCDTGYQLDGVSTRMCQADGTWSDDAPTCICMYSIASYRNMQQICACIMADLTKAFTEQWHNLAPHTVDSSTHVTHNEVKLL